MLFHLRKVIQTVTLYLSQHLLIYSWMAMTYAEFKGFRLHCLTIGFTTRILFLPPQVSWMRSPYSLQLVTPHSPLILLGWSNDRDWHHDEFVRPGSCFYQWRHSHCCMTHPKLPLPFDGRVRRQGGCLGVTGTGSGKVMSCFEMIM